MSNRSSNLTGDAVLAILDQAIADPPKREINIVTAGKQLKAAIAKQFGEAKANEIFGPGISAAGIAKAAALIAEQGLPESTTATAAQGEAPAPASKTDAAIYAEFNAMATGIQRGKFYTANEAAISRYLATGAATVGSKTKLR